MTGGRRFYEGPAGGAKLAAPAVQRNCEPILAVLREWLPPSGLVLEIASGSGEHAVAFAKAFPGLEWQPSDVHPDALGSIEAWRSEANLSNLRPPLEIDAALPDWPIERADAVISINMVHISPWASALGLIDGAARILAPGAPLILYGPWFSDDVAPAAGNLAFDIDLKRRDPEWGVRRIEEFAASAAKHGLNLVDQRSMPANNTMLLFQQKFRLSS